MGYLARWGPKGFLISSNKIVTLNNLTTSLELKKDNGNDTSGTEPTNTRGRELRPISFSVPYFAAAGVDPRDQISQWEAELGNAYPLLIEGKVFGAEKMMLTKVSTSDIKLSNTGKFLSATISITLEEYSDGKTSKLSEKTVSSTSKAGAFAATATGADRASMKPGKEMVTAL